jgi:hypothetical protein
MSIEIVNEPQPPVRPSGLPRIKGHMKVSYVKEATGEVLKESVTDGWQENERRLRDEAHILDVGRKE